MMSLRGLVLVTALVAVSAKLPEVDQPGCGEFKKGDGIAVPTCGNNSEFACGPDGRPLGFIHIQKNAGTTIENLGREHGVRWGRFHKFRDPRSMCVDIEIHPGGADWLATYPLYPSTQTIFTNLALGIMGISAGFHIPPHMFRGEYNPYDEGENFCVLRNPYKKLVSGYTYSFCYDIFRDLESNPDNHDDFRNYAGLLDLPDCSPEGLNHWLQVGIRRYMSQDPLYMYKADCQFASQYEYVFGPDGHQWCHHQVKFEELPHSFNSLMELKGLPIRMSGAANPSSCGKRKCNVTVKDLTPETRALIEEVYSKDFELGGYALIGHAGA